MTVSEFVNSHHRCAINDVPLEAAKVIAVEFPTTNVNNDFQYYVDYGIAESIVQMRFVEGRFFNWMDGTMMHYGIGGPYDLSAIVSFLELSMESDEDEIDVSCDVLADIL